MSKSFLHSVYFTIHKVKIVGIFSDLSGVILASRLTCVTLFEQ